MLEFTDSPAAEELADRARALMDEVVIPGERELAGGTSVSASTIRDLHEAAREYGIYAPQIAEEWGGMGYDFDEVLPTFEQAGRSLLGPAAMRVDAPDEGNMHLLEMQGTELQKEQYLKPLVDGEIRSGFSMTEPLQGAGSDPKMIQTTAEKDGGEWIIDGHKWWTTQGVEADVLLVLARTDEDVHPYEGCSVFIVPAEADGVEVVRNIPHLGGGGRVGHAEIKYNDVRVPEEHLLGEEGRGFQHVQQRLSPARLTHCMRYSGMAERALSIARAYMAEREAFGEPLADKQRARLEIAEREAFGEPLADKQRARLEIAEREVEVNAARSLVRTAADAIAAGRQARVEVSMAKVFAARATGNAIDTAVQYCGGNGIGKDLPLADFYESVRTFRIVDGADEVHLRTIAREAFADVDERELEPVTRYGA